MYKDNMSKIDEIFKTAMDSHSEPYNPEAWDSLSKRLDGGIPPRKNPFLRWGLPSIALVVGVATVWYFTSGTSTKGGTYGKKPQEVINLVQNGTKQQHTPLKDPLNETGADQNLTKTLIAPNTMYQKTVSQENKICESVNDNIIRDYENKISEKVELQLVPVISEKLNNSPIATQEPKPIDVFIALLLPACENTVQEIKNENNFTIALQSDKESIQIKSKESVKVKFVAGMYDVVKEADGMVLQSHKINASGPCEIIISDLYYRDGLPYRHASLKTDAQITAINSKGISVNCCNREQEVLVFKKGNYSLNIGMMHETGCSSTKEETFYVSDDYNLLAVNAFEPLSLDTRKSTFIPYALTQRNTPFRMVIIDPNDGGIVFETSDAQLPWDGIDKRTGKIADTNKAYVWKVNLSKPEPGEKTDYMGTVVRM